MEHNLTIEGLAEQTGISPRTIRFYRQSGLVPAPTRVGRHALYGDDQVDRLRAISSLREQGLSLEAIARVLDQAPSASDLERLTRLGEEARTLWARDRSGALTGAEILDVVGPTVTGTEGTTLLELLESYDVIRSRATADAPDVTATYDVPSLGTLDLAGRLFAAGISPDLAYASWTAMKQWLRPLATDLVKLYSRFTRAGLEKGLPDEAINAAMSDVLPIALRGVQLVFTLEMERALEELVTSGDDPPAWLDIRDSS